MKINDEKTIFSEKRRPTCLSFATHFWVATHSLGNSAVEDLDIAITKLKRGKASGADGLMTEHILFAHPVVNCFFG